MRSNEIRWQAEIEGLVGWGREEDDWRKSCKVSATTVEWTPHTTRHADRLGNAGCTITMKPERLEFLKKVKAEYSSSWKSVSELRSVTCHMGSHRCYLPLDTSERAPPTPANQADTRLTYPRGMEGWVDLGSLIAARPGIEPTTAWSQVRRHITPPSHPIGLDSSIKTGPGHGISGGRSLWSCTDDSCHCSRSQRWISTRCGRVFRAVNGRQNVSSLE